ncbi:hypothetical protein [Actinoallomurus acaciae]|uniref:Uncharacterized protein n=1 Tax=Actinoallomurus acaciae TaxID=502577 RepID=A0ABV5Y6P9_9ACTN
MRSTRGVGRTAWFVVAVLALTAACGDGDRWKAPAPGQAGVLLRITDPGSDADRAFSDIGGMVGSGPDGSVYGADESLVRLKPDRTVETVRRRDSSEQQYNGLAVLPDGSLVVGSGRVVKKVTPQGSVTVLAGSTGGHAPAAVPRSAGAADFRFRGHPRPFGVRPDGSVLIADADTVWALGNGRLTRVHRLARPNRTAKDVRLSPSSAVDGEGTAYVVASYDTPKYSWTPHLGEVTTIRADGTVGRLALPASIAGVPGAPASMTPASMTGDGANGVYVFTWSDAASYVLHIHGGSAEVVARHVRGDRCRVTSRPVSAMRLPCELPWNLTYRRGNLVMAGDQDGRESSDFVLEIRV